MAQRLARKLCPVCKTPLKIPEQALLEAGFSVDDLQGWRPLGPKGCDECNQTGYKGRIGLYQVMPVSDAMRDIIMRGGTSMDLARQAQTEGVLSMRQAGLQRVREGLTSLEEVLRVTNLLTADLQPRSRAAAPGVWPPTACSSLQRSCSCSSSPLAAAIWFCRPRTFPTFWMSPGPPWA